MDHSLPLPWTHWEGEVTDDTGELSVARLDAIEISESFIPPGAVPWHEHPSWSLAFIVLGTLDELSQRGARSLFAGCVLLLPPGWAHSLQIGPRGAHVLRIRWPERDDSVAAPRAIGDRVLISAGLRCLNLWLQLLEASRSDGERLLADCALAELLALLQRPPGRAAQDAGRIERVFAALAADPTQTPSLDTLAARAGLSRSHFCRAFRARFRLSPGEAQRALQLQYALGLLRGSAVDDSCIAQLTGFATAERLDAACLRWLGRSTTQLRVQRSECPGSK